MLSSMLSLSIAAMRMPPSTMQVQGGARVPPPTMQVQGGSRRTWSYGYRGPGNMDEMHVELGSDGRPVNAEFELWQGPGNTAVKSRVRSDDGYSRPVYASVGTGGRSYSNTASIRNPGPLEFPINANMNPRGPYGLSAYQGRAPPMGRGVQRGVRTQGTSIQGGALRTFTIDPSIGSVTINLRSEGMPITAKIDILQGPNSDRQGIDLYSDDGRRKPVSYLLELPGYGSTISIKNEGPLEYPLTVDVVPYGPQRMESAYGEAYDGMMGGNNMMMNGGGGMGGMNGDGMMDRYGRANRYGRGGRYSSHMADGRKWHERQENRQPRGPPPSFAEMEGRYGGGGMMGGYEDVEYGAPPHRGAPPAMAPPTPRGRAMGRAYRDRGPPVGAYY